MLRRTWLIFIFFALAGVMPCFATTPTIATITSIEQSIRLPPGADALKSYDRYYAPTIVAGRSVIKGILLATYIDDERDRLANGDREFWKPGPKRTGRVKILPTEAELPFGISDGGCEEVTIYWDVVTQKIAGIFCNGLA